MAGNETRYLLGFPELEECLRFPSKSLHPSASLNSQL